MLSSETKNIYFVVWIIVNFAVNVFVVVVAIINCKIYITCASLLYTAHAINLART